MSKSICKSNAEIAMLMIMRPAKTAAGRKVQAAVLARVEIAMAIESSLNG
jgi:hypothetical protein